MTNESARIILLQMLDGLDPTTGEFCLRTTCSTTPRSSARCIRPCWR